ncbi:hypothetical protein H5T87_07540 [bacterium]|nr:hypothetical protein [bacterium]
MDLPNFIQGQMLVSRRRNNLSYFYHYDGLGSTKALSDGNQNIQASYIFDAWGNVLQSSGTIVNNYMYLGMLSLYGERDIGEAITYLFFPPTLMDTSFISPALGYIYNKQRKPLKPPMPPDWPWGDYGKWDQTCDPHRIPIFEEPTNCQQKAWNVYIKCLRGKYERCGDFCSKYAGTTPIGEIPSACPMPSPPSHFPPGPPPGLVPSPHNPIEQFSEELHRMMLYQRCLYFCVNTAGTYKPTEGLELGNLPNCIAKAREEYLKCCKRRQ